MSGPAAMVLPGAAAGASAPAEAPPATRAAWLALWTLCAVTLLRWVDQVVLVVGTEPMRKALDLSDVQLGMLQGLGIQLAAAVGAIPLGWLADRFDRRKVLALCVLAWSAATVWRAYAINFDQVMASTVGMAVADAALVPVAYALLPLLFRGRQLSQANLLYYAASALGYSVAMMFAGAIFKALDAHQGSMPAFLGAMESWRSASFIVGSLGPLFALMVLRMPAAGRSAVHRRVPGDAAAVPADTVRGYLRLHWRALAGVHGSTVLLALGLGPLMAWIAPALARRFGLEPASVGAEVGLLFIVSTLAGMAAAGVFQRLLGARHGILVPMQVAPPLIAASALALAATGIADSRVGVYASVLFAMFALIAYNASMPTVYQRIVPAALRARLTALSAAVVTAVSAAGPVVVGQLSDRLQSPNGLLMAIAIIGTPTTAAAALVAWWARSHVRRAVDYCAAADAASAPD